MSSTQHYLNLNFGNSQELNDYKFIEPTSGQSLKGQIKQLSQLNLFIGPNNSGKSRFLRGLFKAPNYSFTPNNVSLSKILAAIQPLDETIQSNLGDSLSGYGSIRRDMFASFKRLAENQEISAAQLTKLKETINRIIENNNFNITTKGGHAPLPAEYIHTIHASIKSIAEQCLHTLGNMAIVIGTEPRVYIPILRGLRRLNHAPADVYLEATKRDYSIEENDHRHLFTGLNLYEALTDLLLGDSSQRQEVAAFEDFLSREFFEGRPVDLVPRRKDSTVYVKIGQDDDIPIHNLGDGIQAIIIFTFPAFTARERTLFFFEEPEVHLHPGMQRRLIELFIRNERLQQHQLFLTTHSNHLLDIAGEYSACSNFVFRREETSQAFKISPLVGPDKAVLHELGARSSSVFLTNASIWVEGITDRMYLREYIRKYLRSIEKSPPIKEDTHYSFLEYGGATIVHWDFQELVPSLPEKIKVASICSQSILVLDGDNRGKATRVDDLRAALGNRLILLQGKEVENLLPLEVLQHTAAEILNLMKKRADVNLLRVDGYHQRDIGVGAYLEAQLNVEGFSGSGTGTVSRKSKFCEIATQYMQTNDDWELPPETAAICKQLVEFVCDANGIRR